MTVDKMAEMIAADPEECKELIPLLWSKVSCYLFKMATNYIRNYGQLCNERGIELGDLKSGCYEVFLKALEQYNPEKEIPFTGYFTLNFKTVARGLLRTNTKTGQNDPLNSADRFERSYAENGSKQEEEDTIGERIADQAPSVEEIVEDAIVTAPSKKRAAKILRKALDKLPSRSRIVIILYYYREWTPDMIAEHMGTKNTVMITQIRENALRCLSSDTTVQELREVYFGKAATRKPPAPRASTLTEWAALERERRRKQQ